ncbi:hypothetical protein Q4489_06620 [Thalassotalea sp. 1_MG-2023]|uniref:hypothetical protein n=1 Tax=Thalassotalea sp. 1_MG-2023 TaxID=3062680 RepID=UPI0026E208D9|nr:hypothetical protein [Thalassotalea sp. 1_MG-2023]MDO6426680.1 hypothetical protein [Thalassotalea sp. 1_MG-2023]
MDYSHWIQKTFPRANQIPEQCIDEYIIEAKSNSKLLREFTKVFTFFVIVIPITLYLNYLTQGSRLNFIVLLLGFTTFGVGSFTALYFEQKVIKKYLKKILKQKHNISENDL